MVRHGLLGVKLHSRTGVIVNNKDESSIGAECIENMNLKDLKFMKKQRLTKILYKENNMVYDFTIINTFVKYYLIFITKMTCKKMSKNVFKKKIYIL